jgi:hypothetical protein
LAVRFWLSSTPPAWDLLGAPKCAKKLALTTALIIVKNAAAVGIDPVLKLLRQELSWHSMFPFNISHKTSVHL